MTSPGETAAVKVIGDVTATAQTRDVTQRSHRSNRTCPTSRRWTRRASVKGARIGEATLLVRYQGKFSTVPVTVLNPKPGFAWKALPQNNYIDQQIDAKLQRLKIQPRRSVDDAGFLRRVSLDLTGQLPTPEEVRAFVADPRRRSRSARAVIDKLIASPRYVDHWTLKWGDLLQINRKYLGEKGVYEFREWIRDSIAQTSPTTRWCASC